MGAWGRNVFQNDTALDIVDEVLDGTFDLDEFRRNFRRDEDEGYLTASQGAALLTLGALVRIARNEDHADLEALLEHAETDEVDLSAFIDQFSDVAVETLRHPESAPEGLDDSLAAFLVGGLGALRGN